MAIELMFSQLKKCRRCVLLFLFFMSGCAAVSSNITSVEQDVFSLKTVGGIIDGADKIKDLSVLRLAEHALANNYPYYEIVDIKYAPAQPYNSEEDLQVYRSDVPALSTHSDVLAYRVTIRGHRIKSSSKQFNTAEEIQRLRKKYHLKAM